MGTRFMAFFIAFVCVLTANNSEGRRKLGENILDNEAQVIDEHTADQVWNYCKKELKDSTEAVEFGSALAAERIIQKAVADLPPKKMETIVDCLREKKFPLQVLKDEQGTLSSKCQNPFSGWVSIPRRYLRHNWSKGRVLSTVDPASAPSQDSTPHDSTPETSDNDYPSPLDTDYRSPSDIFHPSPKAEKLSPIPLQDNNNNRKLLVAAVLAGIMAGLGLLSLVLLVCLKKDRRLEPKDGQRDEKPLLNFSTSGISAGSSENSPTLGNPGSMNFKAPSTPGSSLDSNSDFSRAGTQLTGGRAETVGKIGLPLPPGRTAAAAAAAAAATTASAPAAAAMAAAAMRAAAMNAAATDTAATATGAMAPAATDTEATPAEAMIAAADATSPPPPGPPPPRLPQPAAPAPPPPPRGGRRPPNPPIPAKPSPLGPHHRHTSTGETSEVSEESEAPKTKLKPFFWDKVLASPDHSMVWHEIKAGSFQFNEEMMEALFGITAADKKKHEHRKDSSFESTPQFIQIIDPKKSQNLAILLKALNVTTEEVCDALKEGNELPAEFIQNLLKMAPTSEEELKLRLYGGDLSQLGQAERFLKVVVDIPFAFKRLESLLFVSTFQEEFSSVKDSLTTLEIACKELRNSRLFLKLLEAVLKTGNRMNDGTYRGGAQAFKLDTLLKLSDVKGTDGKTTLLHFVVHEIIRGEGLRAARKLRESQSISSVRTEDLEGSSHETEEYYRNLGLQVVAGLSNDLLNVKKAALIDNEIISESVSKLGQSRVRIKEFLETELLNLEEGSDFLAAVTSFIKQSESDITWLIEEEKRIMALVKNTGDYFHGRAGKEEGAHLFVIVRDFLLMVDRACLDVKSSFKLPSKTQRKDSLPSSTPSPSRESPSESTHEIQRRLFPAMRERQIDDEFSSDDES